jgi:TIR domain
MVPVPALKDCEFSAFISYAHADDEAWFDWVTQFRNELERGLAALLRGVKVPRSHLSGENGPVAGTLSDELKQRIAASFAMIIVVHDNYAQSDWCLRELEYFHALFGDEGLKERLYIVAMGESAMFAVSGGSTWQRLLPGGEQLWIPFFEEQDHNRPRDVYLAPGLVSPAFRAPFERLRSHLAGKIKQSVAAAVATPAAPLPVAAPPRRVAAAPAAAAASSPSVSSVLFGFVSLAAAPATAEALAQLAARGVSARQLSQDAVFNEFADFDGAEHLVLAYDNSAPMLTTLAPGGHLQVQRDAWLKHNRPAANVHWLDLQPGTPPRPEVQALLEAPMALPALLERLAPQRVNTPAAPAQAVRIYIESNRNERTLWEPLGAQIQAQWEAVCRRMAPDRVPPLNLRARGLPVDQIDAYPNLDDADGVVLLWGKKTSEALVAQINKVELKLAPGRDTAPGIVAYLMPPQASSEPVPAWGWQVLRFDARDETAIDVLADERSELERFLEKVFRRHQQRVALGVA